jgi:hypothetical protein
VKCGFERDDRYNGSPEDEDAQEGRSCPTSHDEAKQKEAGWHETAVLADDVQGEVEQRAQRLGATMSGEKVEKVAVP